jgi:hypothetical protein
MTSSVTRFGSYLTSNNWDRKFVHEASVGCIE